MGGQTYKATYESGAWFEIRCMARDLINKESRGESAEMERRLLRAWYEKAKNARTPKDREDLKGYLKAEDVLKAIDAIVPLKRQAGSNGLSVLLDTIDQILHSTLYVTPDNPPARGRPRKVEGELCRMTQWRRKAEQGVLV